ncbi:MAG: hypothetical protein JW829_19595, partial [Pirellulales bacterium]|nr:hypothetical protein [Pirellulales bacterium]
MAGLTPIPTSRISDYLTRTRLTTQLQADQLELFRIQEQVSTGRRISLPSDDAPAALRAITLQRLIERKDQVKVNLTTNQSYLTVTDAALNTVSGLLADIRGSALAVAGTTNTAEQRAAVAQQVNRAIQQLVDVGNQSFRGRYLFAGSRAGVVPYDYVDDFVEYSGNERELRSYSDLDVLFETSITGNQVFGAISEPVHGVIDLNPHISGDTLLASLREGLGISPNGAILVSDGSNTSVVDLSTASTVADVAALIEANPPAGRTVMVDLSSNGFLISLDAGNLTITEVAGGTTARELGIFEEMGAGTGPLIGSDLKPTIELTTPLNNLLGTKSKATFIIPGANNDLLIESAKNGEAYNVDIFFSAGAVAGSEVVTYNAGLGTLEIQIEDGVSTAKQIAAAIRAEGTFNAWIDYRDALTPLQAGTNSVDVGPTVTTVGGDGINLDRSGITITNINQTFTFDFSNTDIVTVEDLLNEINGANAGVLAEINAAGNGI